MRQLNELLARYGAAVNAYTQLGCVSFAWWLCASCSTTFDGLFRPNSLLAHITFPCPPLLRLPSICLLRLPAEVILYSEGFRSAKDLARKVVSIFTLSNELLSKCQHYEWGLRPLKTVLNTGGSLLQKMMAERAAAPTGAGVAGAAGSGGGVVALSPEEEREVLIKAIRVNTLSKLTYEDSQRFLGLMADVFPGARSEDVRSAQLEAAIREVMASKAFGLEFDEGQLRKMLQLKEALDQRIGCLVVGPSGCGKSTLWRVLQAALVKCGE